MYVDVVHCEIAKDEGLIDAPIGVYECMYVCMYVCGCSAWRNFEI